jgi:hypothetical protein
VEKREQHTVVLMADVNELLLQLMFNLLEGLDGLLLGRVGRTQFDGLGGGLGFAVNKI